MAEEDTIEGMDFSLAELGGVDMSEIAEVSFEGLPGGMWLLRGTEGKLEKVDNAKAEKRGKIGLQYEVVEVKTITERGAVPEGSTPEDEFVGKKYRENFWIVPEKPEEGLGMAVKFFRSIGIETDQKKLGGCVDEETGEPIIGIIDEFADGFEFVAKTHRKPRKGDASQKDTVLTPIDVRKTAKASG